MITIQIPPKRREMQKAISDFARTQVRDILDITYRKAALNRLRWVLIENWISHYRLKKMSLIDLILIGDNMECLIAIGGTFLNETIYHRILAARNIIILLNKSLEFNDKVKSFFQLTIKDLIEYWHHHDFITAGGKLPEMLNLFSLSEDDTIQKLSEALASSLDDIINSSDNHEAVGYKLFFGSDANKKTLVAYRLFHIFFAEFFSRSFPLSLSAEAMKKKYPGAHFRDDDLDSFLALVRRQAEGS